MGGKFIEVPKKYQKKLQTKVTLGKKKLLSITITKAKELPTENTHICIDLHISGNLKIYKKKMH